MTRVLRSAVKKNQTKEDLTSKLNACKNSKTKRNYKIKVLAKSEVVQQNSIWNINSILSNIFKYTEKNDLIKFNTVCKRWNDVTNPIIHKTIKLQRKRAFQNKDHDKRFNKAAKTDAEVEMCIANNSKHAKYIKEFNFNENLEPQRAIKLFETFKFITNLTVGGSMSQDQFISMIIPLTQLQELNLSSLGIKRIIKNKFISEPAVLPASLTKLTLGRVYLYKNPELFIQTINSHTNLIEYKFSSYNGANFLDPFFKNYPTLKIFDYNHEKINHSQSLIKVFESNSHLKTLKLSLSCYNDALITSISSHLINLEEFNFSEIYSYPETQISIISKLSHPTKIKKLNLSWDKLSQCSVNSILLYCPYLEELYLKHAPSYLNTASDISIESSKLANIKKLKLRYNHLSKISYNSIITKCAQIKELDIVLPDKWKECMKTTVQCMEPRS
ncbi:RNI-like protein [Conidiobolus coronatus NRRL 28638]|uniref:RNI-like protein n=1 Tax=Conidiobolus coronatus (strain ATCC 28846 / CBS 209.66 / NRRL 28638) TaxID=796925 RepID=A0A137NPA5_CONC2|nr:RNI-like protein [Conidiobolus coronatus NRRL 28638]|eukprot:KXN64565.1 RNI-like protein [Conidiobolus coronatus NRRL 28638]